MNLKHLLAISLLCVFFALSCKKDDPNNFIANLPESDCIDLCSNGGTAIPSTSGEQEFCECECIEPFFGPLCTEYDSSETSFDCINGNCISIVNGGNYSSLEDCQNNCSSSSNYDCIDGNCISVSIGGSFSSISDCQNNCGSSGIESNPGQGVTFDGYSYQSIVLGNGQEWLSENLRTTVYANGSSIPNVTDDAQWEDLSTGAWAYYNNDSQYEIPYGKLYNWYAVNNPSNLCPTGWHVPTDAEWTLLSDYLGGIYVAGGKMKISGTEFWLINVDATNESGFSGLPGGQRFLDGSFEVMGYFGYHWSSSEQTIYISWQRRLEHSSGYLHRNAPSKGNGLSVRCVKD